MLVNGEQHPIGEDVQFDGLGVKYKGSSDLDIDEDDIVDGVRHEFELSPDYTGEYDLVYRVRRYVKNNNESTWTHYDSSSYQTLYSLTSASCQSNEENCGDGPQQCGAGDGSCSGATECWSTCTVAYGNCYHMPFAEPEDDCRCSAAPPYCGPPGGGWMWWYGQLGVCLLVATKDQTLCIVEVSQWATS